MSDVGDIAALWRRIDAWPGELKQALKLEAEAQMKVDDLQRQVDEARESRPSAGEYENNSRRESLLALRFGRPTSRAEAEAQRKVDRAAGALEEARHDATRRLVREYEERGQRTPAERNVHALVESEDDVKALREAHQRAKEELEDIEWPRGEQASTPAARTVNTSYAQESPELDHLTRALAKAENQVAMAGVEVKHQRAVGRALQLLVQLAGAQQSHG